MELESKVAVVTGAGRGIGAGIATVLAKHGADLVLTDRETSGAEETAELIRKTGRKVVVLQHDVTSWESTRSIAEASIAAFGKVDILVTNAGVSKSVPFAELTAEEWDRVNDVNAKGVFLSCRAFVPHMIERKYGKIVNISSMVGKEAIPFFAHYCASKFAVIGLTESMAKELAPHNINVNAVCPGVVRTPLWDPLLEQLSENKKISREEAWEEFVGGIPFKRPQTPEDIGEAVAFLASDRARNITASAANVSGGQMIW
ncbi:NAD(P)-dependent dehydrogenase (short-subunit alcohol dehydrogenase family) [Kaistia hirudinis]|uniref:NAD(P)-dependent dehydrogenase (Short-subunit alcohol dehydrogenase family) n=1 Tax=Kaistia hirudinis TaxID=1293440 RepID=A0A840AQM0_9HYPH|nr:SDR family NAD(P)-dependent oxidoreductase [Kaistia hirudinis]MBB3931161.1 NAD(P)-dependent dehydrogenase (short-subunit alcohol dehydrogenase family) [Kaistia hirudinis]